MHTLLLSLVLVAAPLPSARQSVAGELLTLDIDAAPVANLTYQLDCMAQLMACSTEAYRALWKDKLAWSDEDEKALGEWTALRRKYSGQIRVRGPEQPEPGFPVSAGGIDLEARLRFAGLVATDLASYRSHLGLLVLPADADRATQLLGRFQPRFEGWWRETALRQLEPFLAATAELLKQRALLPFFEKAARFYEADLPKGTHISMHLVLRPATKRGNNHGQQLEDHALVEVLEGEHPEDRIDVVAHELFHYFYFSAPHARAVALARQFIDAPAPEAMAAYGLINESVATALGNGLVAQMVLPKERFEKLLQKPNSLYAESAIDLDAKALLAPLAKLLAEGKSISDPAFTQAQLKAAQAARGPKGVAPALYLKTMEFGFDPQFAELRPAVREQLRSGSMWGTSPLDDPRSVSSFTEYPLLSGLVLIAPGELGHLARWEPVLGKGTLEKVQAAAKEGDSLVYGVRRGEKAWVWLLIAPNPKAMRQLLTSFAQVNEPVVGAWRPPATASAP